MPNIIRKALAEKILRAKEVRSVLRDLGQSSGMRIRFVDLLGNELHVEPDIAGPEICDWMRGDTRRAKLCTQCMLGMMSDCGKEPGIMKCPAGLWEAVIPLRLWEETFGYLMLGQVADQPENAVIDFNRWRHTLESNQLEYEPGHLHALQEGQPHMERKRFEALVRTVRWSVQLLIEQHVAGLTGQQRGMHPTVEKACNYVRCHATDSEISLTAVAEYVGLSPQHLSGIFHHSTGLRFTEYVTRVRLELACEKLQHTRLPVTQIAFQAGFQSVSSFNRSFQALMQMSPREFRNQKSGLHIPNWSKS